MKHPDASCECAALTSPLTLLRKCSVCGRTAIMKISILAAVCDGDTITKAELDELAPNQHRY